PVPEPAPHPTPAPSPYGSSATRLHRRALDSPRTNPSFSAPVVSDPTGRNPLPLHRAVADTAAHFPSRLQSGRSLRPACARSVPPTPPSTTGHAVVQPPPSRATAAPAELLHPDSGTLPGPLLPATESALSSPDRRLPSAYADQQDPSRTTDPAAPRATPPYPRDAATHASTRAGPAPPVALPTLRYQRRDRESPDVPLRLSTRSRYPQDDFDSAPALRFATVPSGLPAAESFSIAPRYPALSRHPGAAADVLSAVSPRV